MSYITKQRTHLIREGSFWHHHTTTWMFQYLSDSAQQLTDRSNPSYIDFTVINLEEGKSTGKQLSQSGTADQTHLGLIITIRLSHKS